MTGPIVRKVNKTVMFTCDQGTTWDVVLPTPVYYSRSREVHDVLVSFRDFLGIDCAVHCVASKANPRMLSIVSSTGIPLIGTASVSYREHSEAVRAHKNSSRSHSLDVRSA